MALLKVQSINSPFYHHMHRPLFKPLSFSLLLINSNNIINSLSL